MGASRESQPQRKKRTRNVGRKRAETLLLHEIDFIHNVDFEEENAIDECLACDARGQLPGDEEIGRRAKRPNNVPAYFASLYETPLLRPEQERRAFRRMNFAKFRANALRSQLDPQNVEMRLVREIERLIVVARETRDAIVRANLRLVVSVARRFANDRDSFDDLVGEGNMTLLQAVDKFDYGRGFRFSTYATHAIQRTFYRRVAKTRKVSQRFVTGSQEVLGETARQGDENEDQADQSIVRAILQEVSESLDDREQLILNARFGLQRETAPETLQVVAEKLGICKERVRQLQIRAISKLREFAVERGLSPEPLVAAAS